MEEKELKTSGKQRFFIILIAVLMLGSVIAGYIAIVLSGSANKTKDETTSSQISEEKVAEYEEAYKKVEAEFKEASKSDFDKFINYKSEIKAYNETTANSGGVSTRDLEVGSGRELKDGDSDYLAYYVGWCADESIFDSSFDDNDKPTAFAKILDASLGMIEGWNAGIIGMKIGGIREMTISSELAYKEQDIACGSNKPLKFMVMTKEKEGDLATLAAKLDDAYMRYQYALYGIDYDEMMNQ